MLPSGSEQALSLKWALERIAGLTAEDAAKAICSVFGFPLENWERVILDRFWRIGDRRWKSREQIEEAWNQRFSQTTERWLDEDAWHAPLWQLWLPDPKMTFAANLEYLLKLQGHGSVSQLAKFIGRRPNTASKWARWREEGRKVRVPPRTVEAKILEFFGLKPSCDLYREPIFLGGAEIRDLLMRIEAKHLIDHLVGEHLSQAVERLRDEWSRQTAAGKRDSLSDGTAPIPPLAGSAPGS